MAADQLLRALRRHQQADSHYNRAVVTTVSRYAGGRLVLIHALGWELVHRNRH